MAAEVLEGYAVDAGHSVNFRVFTSSERSPSGVVAEALAVWNSSIERELRSRRACRRAAVVPRHAQDISAGRRTGAITVPTTYVWSTDDIAIGRRAAELTGRWVTGPFDFKVLNGVSHWIPEQVPDALAAYILERISSRSPTT